MKQDDLHLITAIPAIAGLALLGLAWGLVKRARRGWGL